MALQKSGQVTEEKNLMKVNKKLYKSGDQFYRPFDNKSSVFEFDVHGNEGISERSDQDDDDTINNEAYYENDEMVDFSCWSYWRLPLSDFDDGYSNFIDPVILEEHTFGMDRLHSFPISPFDVVYEDDGGGGITSGSDVLQRWEQERGNADVGDGYMMTSEFPLDTIVGSSVDDGEVNRVKDDEEGGGGGFLVLGWWDKCWLFLGLWKLV